jgi:hypothetical protein
MDPRQSRLVLFLVAALLLLLALLLIPGEKAEDPAEGLVLGALSPDGLDRLTLTGAKGVLEAHRRGSDWILTKPQPGAGDAKALDGLVETLGLWRLEDTLVDADPADHGLAPAAFTVSVALLDGAAPSLEVGAVAPGGGHTYARFPDGPVLVIKGDITPELSRPLIVYRDRRLIGMAVEEILRIDWMFGGRQLAVRREAGGPWMKLDGSAPPTGEVEGILAALEATRLESFQDDLTAEEAGLAPAAGRIVLSGPAGEAEIALGGPKLGGVLVGISSGQIGTIGEVAMLFPPEFLAPELAP